MLFYLVVTSIGFGFWPLIAKSSNLPPLWIAVSVAIGTLLVVSAPMSWSFTVPVKKFLIIGLIAGVVNGFGHIAFAKILAAVNSGLLEGSMAFPVIMISALVIQTVGAIVFFREGVSLTKISGVVLGVVAVYLLSRSG